MCFMESRISSDTKYNWDGDWIIHDSVVPSSRPPVGRSRGQYDVDVREFLVSERNAVMRQTLEQDLRQYLTTLPGGNWEFFKARTEGAFDYRANVIAEFVSEKIRYEAAGRVDPWQFPEETLSLKSGDCEDRALLIASLLLASGISSFNVRVALGRFRAWFGNRHQDFDHAWVMYKDEAGGWHVIEPSHAKTVSTRAAQNHALPDRAEYIPFYLFNDVHLWQVRTTQAEALRTGKHLKRDWSRLHPEFAGSVHKSILNAALTPDVCPAWVLNALNRHFTSYLWQQSLTVDDVDSPASYHPFDHFDNGYIDEGWQRVNQRLQAFQQHSVTSLDAFHLAAHAIADFYAHSSYGHFGRVQSGELALYDPANPQSGFARGPDYGANSTFNFSDPRLTQNKTLWKGSSTEAAALWQDRVISGRYAQKGDTHGLIESITTLPKDLTRATDFGNRGGLPHHNEIAVDEEAPAKPHVLYSASDYAQQYQRRYNAAIRHIRQAFTENWKP